MKLHPRHVPYTKARGEVEEALLKASKEHELTSTEIVMMLLQMAASWQKYVLRDERVATDPNNTDNVAGGCDGTSKED